MSALPVHHDESDVCEQLRRLTAEVRRLGDLIEHRKPLSQTDRELLEAFFAIFGEPGNRGIVFATRDALADLERNAVVLAAVRSALGDGDLARRIGKLFARACGHSINGLMLERVSAEAGAALWSLRRV